MPTPNKVVKKKAPPKPTPKRSSAKSTPKKASPSTARGQSDDADKYFLWLCFMSSGKTVPDYNFIMQKLDVGYKTVTGRFYKLRKQFGDLDPSEGPAQNEDPEKPSDKSNPPTDPEAQVKAEIKTDVKTEIKDDSPDHPSSDLTEEEEYA